MKLSMKDALEKAQENNYKFLNKDYYALSRNEKDDLRELMEETSFVQSASSKAAGRTKIYQFWVSLYNKDKGPKRKPSSKNSGMRGTPEETGLGRTPSKFKFAIGQKVKINGKSQEYKDGQTGIVRSRFTEDGKEYYRLEGMKGKNGNYIEFAESALSVGTSSKKKAPAKPKASTSIETVEVPGHWVDGFSYKRKVTPKMKEVRKEFKEKYVKKGSKTKKK